MSQKQQTKMNRSEYIDDARWEQLMQEEAERRRIAEAEREKLIRDLEELHQWYNYEVNYHRPTFNIVMQQICEEKRSCRQHNRVYVHNMVRLYEGWPFRLHNSAAVDKDCLAVAACRN
jgi:hypothetical protein